MLRGLRARTGPGRGGREHRPEVEGRRQGARARGVDGENMTIKDIGPQPQSFDLEKATLESDNYRAGAWSGTYLQLTLMSITPGKGFGPESTEPTSAH